MQEGEQKHVSSGEKGDTQVEGIPLSLKRHSSYFDSVSCTSVASSKQRQLSEDI